MPSSSEATPLEVDVHGDHSSSEDTDIRSMQTQSATSSVRDYRFEDGRRYHAYLASLYLFPNDETEQDRLNLQHHIFRLSMDNTLNLAPLPKKTPITVLDAGCGTGIWTIEFAERYPEATVVGVDLSPIQPDTAPENCSFRVDNLESDWIPDEMYDFIHTRAMILGIRDWPRLFEQAFEHLKPGGYIELQDFCLPMAFMGEPPTQSTFLDATNHMMEASARMGIDFTIPRRWRQQMKDVGFVDLQQKWFNWPIGPWAKHKKNKLLGRLLLADLHDGLGAAAAMYTSALGWTTDDTRDFIQRAKDDLMSQKHHWYMHATVIYGRKPESHD